MTGLIFWKWIVRIRSVDGRFLAVCLLSVLLYQGPAYGASHTIDCHAIRFHKSVMTDISVDGDRNWYIHLSDRRLAKSKQQVESVNLYLGRKGRKAYAFPAQREGKSLRIELRRDRNFITNLRKFRWLGYRFDKSQKIVRVRITDARETIGELIANCEGK